VRPGHSADEARLRGGNSSVPQEREGAFATASDHRVRRATAPNAVSFDGSSMDAECRLAGERANPQR